MTRSTRNAIVVVTGAASGMGLLYAQRAAGEGAKAVVMWDVDATALESAASAIRAAAPGVRIVAEAVDITAQGAIEDAATSVLRDVGVPDVLINNAGIVRGKWFWDHDPGRDIDATMAVNTIAPMQITRQFLPAMIADSSRPRRILSIASAAGLFSTPRMAVYAASKAGLIGWSDSLRLELRGQGYGHIAVTTVMPSFVSTGMFAGAKAPLITPILTPEVVVDRVWAGMLAGRARVILPRSVTVAVVLRGVLPVAPFDWLADHVLRIYGSMSEFTGRSETP
ncbi:SDR family NAD(P)-dependent oxidoreductase [soil metagenome]